MFRLAKELHMRSKYSPQSTTLIAFLVLSLFILSGCAGNSASESNQTNTEPSVAAPAGDQSTTNEGADQDDGFSASEDSDKAAGASKIGINISELAFKPSAVRIKAGTTVVWTNTDMSSHQVHADDDVYQLEIIYKGEQSEQLFTEPGTYTYHCHVHPNMQGTVIVE